MGQGLPAPINAKNSFQARSKFAPTSQRQVNPRPLGLPQGIDRRLPGCVSRGSAMRLLLGLIIGLAAAHPALASEAPSALIVSEARVAGNPQLVAAALVEEMSERQFTLVGQAANELRFARPVDNAALRAELGSLADPLPQARVIASLSEAGGATAVRTDFFIVTHPGSTRERLVVEAAALGIDPRFQEMLDSLSGTVEAIALREAETTKTALAQAEKPSPLTNSGRASAPRQ